MKKTKGIVGMSSLVGLVILAVALPFLNNIIKKPQDTRNRAVEEEIKCGTVKVGQKYCTNEKDGKYAVCGKDGKPEAEQKCTGEMQCSNTSTGIRCDCVDKDGNKVGWANKYCTSEKTWKECGGAGGTCTTACEKGLCATGVPEKEDCKGVAKGDRYCTGETKRTWKQCGGDLKGTCADYDCLNGYCGPVAECNDSKPCPAGKVCKDKVCIAEKECRDKSGAIVREGQGYCTGAVGAGTWLTCGKTSGGTCPSDRPVCKYGATGAGAECIKDPSCGRENQNCCDGTTRCDEGLECTSVSAGMGVAGVGTMKCVKATCGKINGRSCCSDGTCDRASNLLCKDDKCQQCGKKDHFCCVGDKPCDEGKCVDGKCKTDTTTCIDKVGGDKIGVGETGCSSSKTAGVCKADGTWETTMSCMRECKNHQCTDDGCGGKNEDCCIHNVCHLGFECKELIVGASTINAEKYFKCREKTDTATSCTDGVNGKIIAVGSPGCKDSSTYAYCVDGKSNKWEKEIPCGIKCGTESKCIDCGAKDQLCCPPGNTCKDSGLTCKNVGLPSPIGAVWMCKEKTDTTTCTDKVGGDKIGVGETGCSSSKSAGVCKADGTWETTKSCMYECKNHECTADTGCSKVGDDCCMVSGIAPFCKGDTLVCGGTKCVASGKCPLSKPNCSTCGKNLGSSYTEKYNIIGADYNCDGKVNIADYSVWRGEFFDKRPWKGSSNWWTDAEGEGVDSTGYSRWNWMFLR